MNILNLLLNILSSNQRETIFGISIATLLSILAFLFKHIKDLRNDKYNPNYNKYKKLALKNDLLESENKNLKKETKALKEQIHYYNKRLEKIDDKLLQINKKK